MIRWLRAEIDRSDVTAGIGLAMLAGGLLLIDPPLALIVPGALLFTLAVLPPLIRGR